LLFRSNGATFSMSFEFVVQRTLRVDSEVFGTSGLRRSFRPGLSASSWAIQAILGPLGLESLIFELTMALTTVYFFSREYLYLSFFWQAMIRESLGRKILYPHSISIVTSGIMNGANLAPYDVAP
jgi:hypothetical protein